MYKRKHFPGLVLPARPALETFLKKLKTSTVRSSNSQFYLCCADALLIGDTNKLSTRIRGLYTFCLANPGSEEEIEQFKIKFKDSLKALAYQSQIQHHQ